MRSWICGRSIALLLAACMMVTMAPADAAPSSVPRHAAQRTAKEAGSTVLEDMKEPQEGEPSSVLLRWQPVPGAVRYAVRVMRAEGQRWQRTLETMSHVYTTGLHLPLQPYGAAADLYWTVQPLGYDGAPIGEESELRPVQEATADPAAPALTTEYAQMPYAPLYPVYSWIPLAGQLHHEVEVYRREGGQDRFVHALRGGEYDVYDDAPYIAAGRYLYRVRGVTEAGDPLSAWSDYGAFTVADRTPVAALGDSITHGGGAITVPPSYQLYDWETYCSVPVKNLGHSGDTTEELLRRFERDVLPFSPRVLVIMGGVNDYRVGINPAETIDNLVALREKCRAHGITPVFLTPTPIRPSLMTARMAITPPPADWWAYHGVIGAWVMQQEYSIDVSTVLGDADGALEAAYTTDGLHPDYMGKKYIGERVDEYLRTHFAYASGEAERRVRTLKQNDK